MTSFTIMFVSADRQRTHKITIQQSDIDDATSEAIEKFDAYMGSGSNWFIGGVWQEDLEYLVYAAVEEQHA